MAFSGTKVNLGVLNENNKLLIYKQKLTKRYSVQRGICGTHNPLVVGSSPTRPTSDRLLVIVCSPPICSRKFTNLGLGLLRVHYNCVHSLNGYVLMQTMQARIKKKLKFRSNPNFML